MDSEIAVPGEFRREIESGDMLRALEAVRRGLAASFEEATPRERPALARELALVLVRIEALTQVEGATTVDNLRARREARRAEAG